MRPWMIMIVGSVALAGSLEAQQQPAQFSARVQEWVVPWKDTRPRDPMADQQGRVWFVGQAGNYVAYLEPASGKFKRFEIDPGTHPHTVIVDNQGRAWYAGNRNAMIGRIDPASGAITRFKMTDPALADPHTMVGWHGRCNRTPPTRNHRGRIRDEASPPQHLIGEPFQPGRRYACSSHAPWPRRRDPPAEPGRR